jgi:hypothetical protein
MSCSVTNVRIEPVDVSWQIEEQWTVKCFADVASSLNNDYFKIYTPAGGKFHVWFNVAAAGVDPAPAGFTAIPVAIAANASASVVALAVQVAVDAHADFKATVVGSEVLITCVDIGETVDFSDFNTGFTFTQCADGLDLPLGLCDGDIELTTEEQLNDIVAHQSGTTILASLRQGTSAEISMTLKESDFDKFKAIYVNSGGGVDTPSGGTEVFGRGTSRQGTNTFIQAKRLILHPVNKASNDYTRDFCFWRAYPKPDTLTFSGENPQMLSLTFTVYKDDSKPDAINMWCAKDWTQYLPA